MHSQDGTDLAVVSDFFAYQFDAIISAIEKAKILHQIQLFMHPTKPAFRLFVPETFFEETANITIAIEKSGICYDETIALAKYNFFKLQQVKTMTDKNGTVWVKVSDFYNHQLNPTLRILKDANIPYLIQKFGYQAGFRLFVALENLERAKELCQINATTV
ncbi:hypothetical protein [Microcoleus sp. B4-C1]|uniref:hypothetical protein n=1 Tax=Microcoleus sp. B4-C1 TaxID=2818660 RepID=UPI002FD39366